MYEADEFILYCILGVVGNVGVLILTNWKANPYVVGLVVAAVSFVLTKLVT